MYSIEYNHIQYQINQVSSNIKYSNEKSHYENVLDNTIYHWAIDNHREPKHIVLHPNTWQYIGSQLGLHGQNDWTVENKYKGLKVYKSFDVEENKFEIG
jgi:hypothetical protein